MDVHRFHKRTCQFMCTSREAACICSSTITCAPPPALNTATCIATQTASLLDPGRHHVDQWTGLLSSTGPVIADNKRPLLPCVEEDDLAVADIHLSPLPTLNRPSDQLHTLINPSTVCNETVASECPQVATVTASVRKIYMAHFASN